MVTGSNNLARHIAQRRRQLELSKSAAVTVAQVSRPAWDSWENGVRLPQDSKYGAIERALKWQPGSVEAVLAGGEPTPAQPTVDDEEREYRAYLADRRPRFSAAAIERMVDTWRAERRRILDESSGLRQSSESRRAG